MSESLIGIPDTLDLAQKLIGIDSTSQRSNLEIIDYIQPILETFHFDVERDKFGWTVLEGYEYEYLTNALRKLDETDKGSYFLLVSLQFLL